MRILKENTCAIMIDLQEKLVPVMFNSQHLLERCKILLNGLNVLKIPLIVSEQYPKGLGTTVSKLQDAIDESSPIIEKTSFSCLGSDTFESKLKDINRDIHTLNLRRCTISKFRIFGLVVGGRGNLLLRS